MRYFLLFLQVFTNYLNQNAKPMKFFTVITTLLLCFGVQRSFAQKTVFWPTEWQNPANEYYQRMSTSRMYESKNFVVFWGDLVGTTPETYSDPNLRFNPQSVADTLETSFSRYIDDLHFINNDSSTNFGKYKTIVVMYGTFSGNDARTNGFAVGSSYSNTIGAMFVHPTAVKDGGTVSHEFTHCLQQMMHIQENPGYGHAFAGYDWAGPFFETHANYMRAQVYQKWTQIDGTLTRWIQTRNYMWSSARHNYTCYNLLFYVQEKDGFDITRRLWAESKNEEHPLETLKRLKGFTQDQLNDYLWGYAAKDVAFDYPIQWNDQVNPNSNFGIAIRGTYQLIKNSLPRYTSRQYTLLDTVPNSTDRYYVNENWAPQDYGINIIPLYPTCTATDQPVSVKFKGHTEVNPDYAGWRYGFVTTKADGTVSRYSPMYSASDGEASFNLNTATEANIYFVVYSAPKIHHNYYIDEGYPKHRRYPYELKIANAVPEGYQAPSEFRKWRKTNGSLHPNGGGWVSSNANVASTAYVGPYAMVLGGTVSGNARIEDYATVEGGNVNGNAILRDNACVYNATISDNAIVEGNAWMEGGSATGSANLKGNAMGWAADYGNSVVVGGDAEIGSCSTNGVYLQFPYYRNGRTQCDGLGATDPSNIDINGTFTLFTDAQMNFSTTPSCDGGTYDCANVKNGTATIDSCGKCVGGTTGAVSDDSDHDGTLDCKDGCPYDPNKIAPGFCGCGVAEGTCGTGPDTLTYNVQMAPMSNYTPTNVILDSAKIAAAFNLTPQAVMDSFGLSVIYYGVNPDGSLNPTSTANAPGHWFNQAGQTIAYGANAYIYSELDINSFSVNIGQYPNRSQAGDTYTIRQALVYVLGSDSIQVTLVFNVSVGTVTGLNGTMTERSVSIYPNPSKEGFRLQTAFPTTIQVLDVYGKLLEEHKTSSNVEFGNDLSPGVYFVKVANKIYKVIKE